MHSVACDKSSQLNHLNWVDGCNTFVESVYYDRRRWKIQAKYLSLSMGTHDSSQFVLQIFVYWHHKVAFICRFQPCNGFMWFRGSDSNLLLSKSQWNVDQCQHSEITDIFCSDYEFWQFYIGVFNLISRIVVNYRSSLQSWDLRFFRGDLRVFDFFGNTHREAHIWSSNTKACNKV